MHANESGAITDHEQYMRRCIELAQIAQSRKNTPVGSVVVIDEVIVGEGIEEVPAETNVTGHAEVLARQSAVHQTGNKLLEGGDPLHDRRAVLHVFICHPAVRDCCGYVWSGHANHWRGYFVYADSN